MSAPLFIFFYILLTIAMSTVVAAKAVTEEEFEAELTDCLETLLKKDPALDRQKMVFDIYAHCIHKDHPHIEKDAVNQLVLDIMTKGTNYVTQTIRAIKKMNTGQPKIDFTCLHEFIGQELIYVNTRKHYVTPADAEERLSRCFGPARLHDMLAAVTAGFHAEKKSTYGAIRKFHEEQMTGNTGKTAGGKGGPPPSEGFHL